MEQRIQFTRAADGTRIAFATSGEGPLLISVPAPPDNHVQLEWDDTERRKGLEHVSRFRRLVRYDGRGTGLSDREVEDLSLAARVSDLAAVVERLGVETVALLSGGHGNQVAVAYAAEHPERVSHLVAVNPFTIGTDFMSAEQLAMYSHMLATDFRMFTDVIGAQTFGWGNEEGPRYAAFFRACVEPAMAGRIYEEMARVDLAEYLPRVRCPVLVIRSAGAQMVPESATREFAAAIEHLHLASIGGAPSEGPSDEMLVRMGAFFGEDWAAMPAEPAAAEAPAESPPEFRTVLFTDIEGHTGMMTRLGDAAGREVLRRH
jgi:pimeloyl-ACP methyl ester carboxylesterase